MISGGSKEEKKRNSNVSFHKLSIVKAQRRRRRRRMKIKAPARARGGSPLKSSNKRKTKRESGKTGMSPQWWDSPNLMNRLMDGRRGAGAAHLSGKNSSIIQLPPVGSKSVRNTHKTAGSSRIGSHGFRFFFFFSRTHTTHRPLSFMGFRFFSTEAMNRFSFLSLYCPSPK